MARGTEPWTLGGEGDNKDTGFPLGKGFSTVVLLRLA